MIILLIATSIVGLVSGLLLTYRYAVLFPYVLVGYIGVYYIFSYDFSLKFGGINVYGWDLLIAFAVVNIFIRLSTDGVSVGKGARMLIFGLFSYVLWLEFSEFVRFFSDSNMGFDNLIRTSVVSLYPLVALSIVLSCDEKQFKNFMWFVVMVAIAASIGLVVKEVLDIGAFKTSSGTIRRGKGEMTVLLHIGMALLLFQKKLSPMARYPGVLILLIGVALLGHRSSFVGTAVLLMVFLIFTLRGNVDTHKAIFLVPMGAFSSVLLIAFIIFSEIPAVESFRTRLIDTVDTENQTSVGRLQKWTVAMRSVKENPLGGTKLNSLPDYYGRYLAEADFGRFNISEAHGAYIYLGEATPWPPHNMFINILSRNGIIGLGCFLMVVLGTFLTSFSRDVRTKTCIFAIIASNFIFLALNNHHHYATLAILFVFLVSMPIRLRMLYGEELCKKK
ncbi:MAG: hypothetical protein COC09_04170 [Gammaproteobacteria bacterium]|nr:O-antigen ligase family protein [Gammaproteobacteria bacterium]PCH63993.1 MAG: hypothetical protein COC09_04170 [Gammaproteobacteria bacterium]